MRIMKKKSPSSKKSPKGPSGSLSKENSPKNADIQEKINSDPDFIHCIKHKNSIKEFLQHCPKVKEHQIARLLKIPKKEVSRIFRQLLKKLKISMES